MVEEEKRVQNGGDMAPQEDSAKLPLTDGNEAAAVEVKAAASTDATVDMPPSEEVFKGLTKDELMQYAKEPFWVRLRIFLMIFFWAGWLAMLGLAVLIIIRAPSCEPPPTSTWLQQSPILQLDINDTPAKEATSLLEKLGITSLYIPGLISDYDYNNMNINYTKETVLEMLMAVSGTSGQVVTDFVPSPVQHSHLWLKNDSYANLLDPTERTLNYDAYNASNLFTELLSVFQNWGSEYNVTGFLVPADELDNNPDLRNLTLDLNTALNPDIVIGESVLDLNAQLDNLINAGSFKEIVTQNLSDWTYFKFHPVKAPHRTASPALMPAVTMALMLLEGTPLLQVSASELETFKSNFTEVVTKCSSLRESDAIKFGATQFANTSEQVVAFTRTLKGTPGFAIAVNLGLEVDHVDFSKLNFVPDTGTFEYQIGGSGTRSKMAMRNVTIEANSGLVLQFVAKY